MKLGKTTALPAAVLLTLALAKSGSTQPPPAGIQPGNTVLIAQYECSPGDLAKVDQLMKEMAAPVLTKYASEGKILAWGFLGAYIGGPVNRTIYVWAKDPVALLQARQQYLPEIMAKPGWGELGRLCPKQQVSLSNLIAN